MSRSLIYHTHLDAKGSAAITNDHGQDVSTELSKIAKNSVIVTCNRSDFERLCPKTPALAPRQTISLNMSFGLPEVGKIQTQCNLTAIRRLSRDLFELQMDFTQSDERAIHTIEHYVDRKLRNAHQEKASVSNIIHTNVVNEAIAEEDVKQVA